MMVVSLAAFAAASSQQAPWWVYGVVLGGLCLIVLFFAGLNYLEKRGIIRGAKAYTARAAPLILELQGVVEPRTRHVQQVRRQRRVPGDKPSDPPSSDERTTQ